MSGRLIAIGDIHGCLAAFETVLGAIEPRSEDKLVLLGDYVDRGPDSRGVVERIFSLRDECQLITLMGNHEEMLLRAFDDPRAARWWLPHGGHATLDSYGMKHSLSEFPAEHIAFFRNCELLHETDDYFFVHANYTPNEPLDEQPHEMMLWKSLSQWTPPPHMSGKTAVVGHSSQKDGHLVDLGHMICLDTYCCGGQWLTAMEFPSRRVWQSDAGGTLRDPT